METPLETPRSPTIRRPGGMRVCPAGLPVKAHALVVSAGFQHPASAVAPRDNGATAYPVAALMEGGILKKLKWWQWGLILLFGAGAVGAIIDPPSRPQGAQQASRFEAPNAAIRPVYRDTIFTMTFNEGADPDALPGLAREHCGARSPCQVLGWTDPEFAARGSPMTDREIDHLAFSYSLNRGNGHEQALWDCDRWKRSDRAECLRQ